jgi:hypothetical protein
MTSRQGGGVSGGQLVLGTVGNVVWLVCAGIWLMLGYVIAGLLACITIIGIPFGVQAFKLAGYALWPFNRTVVRNERSGVSLSIVGNVIWLIVGGWWLAVAHVMFAFILVITVVGAPLALASLKMAGLALAPFGRKVVPR